MRHVNLVILIMCFSIFSCNNTEEETEIIKELKLTLMEEYIDDELIFTYSFSYDSTGVIQRVTNESETQTMTYTNTIEDGISTSLDIETLFSDQTYNTGYDIQYFTDETLMYERERNWLMVVQSTGRFLDNVRVYFSSRRDIFFETEFVRDDSDNLIEINIYEPNQDLELFLSGKFLYSNHSLEHDIPFAMNPAIQDIFFDYQIFYALGYQLSAHTPFDAVYSSPDGSFMEPYASASHIESSDITGLERFAFTQANNGEADWRVDLFYQ